LPNEPELDGDPSSGNRQRAVFLSYASEDSGAAERICESLRAAGIEAWLDQVNESGCHGRFCAMALKVVLPKGK
jgi:hypothetical protein